MAHIIDSANAEGDDPIRFFKEVRLVCEFSNARLSDPILRNGMVLQRQVQQLHEYGQALHQPSAIPSPVQEIDATDIVFHAINLSKRSRADSVLLLEIQKISELPPLAMKMLDNGNRDFSMEIRRANRSLLKTYGPLEVCHCRAKIRDLL